MSKKGLSNMLPNFDRVEGDLTKVNSNRLNLYGLLLLKNRTKAIRDFKVLA